MAHIIVPQHAQEADTAAQLVPPQIPHALVSSLPSKQDTVLSSLGAFATQHVHKAK